MVTHVSISFWHCRFLQAVASFPIPESDESNLLQTHLVPHYTC